MSVSCTLLAAALAVSTAGFVGFALAYFGKSKKTKREKEENELFLRTVAHDLRSPLGGIKAYANSLLSNELSGESKENALLLISSEAERLSRIASRLTDGDDSVLKPIVFDIGECAHFTVMTLEQKAKRKACFFVEKGYDEFTPIYTFADKSSVHEAVYNLCDNAVKYSDEGKPIILSFSEQNGRICGAVENYCADFDPSDSENLFSHDFRGKSSKGTKGTGLGLYIAQKLITAQGGKLYFSYNAPICTFHIELPIAPTLCDETEA